MIKIGSVKIKTNIFLAPLSGCSDLAFRLIAREHGAKFCFLEMLDANSLKNDRAKNYEMMKSPSRDKPVAAQILGTDPAMMLDAAKKIIDNTGISFLDINFACPAKKVVKKKAGAYLLRDKSAMSSIIRKLSSGIPIPVTVKIRTGYDRIDIPYITDIAKRCEDAGAKAIFVHGRTKAQQYSGDIDYNSIKMIKESVNIPVFGSGNILSPELAKKMLNETGCDGILVARGALGNPWIFSQIEDYLKKGRYDSAVSLKTKIAVLKKHILYINKHKEISQSGKIGFMRKVSMWYSRALPEAREIRRRLARAGSYKDILMLVDSL